MPTSSSPVDPVDVQARMRHLLFALLAQSESNPFTSAEAIPADAELSAIGMTSIDFLDFAMSVEREFDVAVLETIEPREPPLSLCAGQQYVCQRSAARSA